MVSRRSKGRGESEGGGTGNQGDYEESRVQRIRENIERMKSLGIFDLSKNLKPQPPPRKILKPRPPLTDQPPRRSSRLKDVPRFCYLEAKTSKKTEEKSVENVEIHIAEGENLEIYTEEDEKLLGNSEIPWTLDVDGYDEEGQRLYDPILGKSCHQCRQKVLRRHTECSKCKIVTGQFCGDCLYMRYGENVIEVNLNPNWICPVCRGICNCSRCRRKKGWSPTGVIYTKVVALGYKSVAHYLIQNGLGGNPTSVNDMPSCKDVEELSLNAKKSRSSSSGDGEYDTEQESGDDDLDSSSSSHATD